MVGRQVNITEFLLARIAEDEAEAHAADARFDYEGGWRSEHVERVLRECAAKRAIMDIHSDRDGDCARCSDYAWFAILDGGEHEEFPCPTIRHLAAVYADHQDYQPEWAPQQ